MVVMVNEEVSSRTSIRIYLGKIMVVGPPVAVYCRYPHNPMCAPMALAEAYSPGASL